MNGHPRRYKDDPNVTIFRGHIRATSGTHRAVVNKCNVASLSTGLLAPINDAASDLLIRYDKSSNVCTTSNAPAAHPNNNDNNTNQRVHAAPSESSSVMASELLKGFRELKINMLKSINKITCEAFRQQPYGNHITRVFPCFNCGKLGHKKYDCPHVLQSNGGDATGSNTTPTGTHNSYNSNDETKIKANEHHF
ncbi:CCHC-type zinc finger transcription factor [Mucor lusitanicus]